MARTPSKTKRTASRREASLRRRARLQKQEGKVSLYMLAALEGTGVRLPYRRVVE